MKSGVKAIQRMLAALEHPEQGQEFNAALGIFKDQSSLTHTMVTARKRWLALQLRQLPRSISAATEPSAGEESPFSQA